MRVARRQATAPVVRRRGVRPAASAALLALGLLLALPQPPAVAAFIGEDQEIRIGRQAAAQLEAEVGLAADAGQAARLAAIGRRVAAASDRPGLPYTFKVLRGREVNAISLPGGFIYATEGLMRFAQSDDELAFVMAHEVGHVAARHHVSMIERHFLMGVLAGLLLGRDATAAQIGEILRFLLSRGFSRENEFAADRLGVRYAHRAGFDASAGLGFMQRLRVAEGRDPGQFEVLLRTHPALTDRIQRVRQELRTLGYRAEGHGCAEGAAVAGESCAPSEAGGDLHALTVLAASAHP
jgi:predicted Zn-dependent protease